MKRSIKNLLLWSFCFCNCFTVKTVHGFASNLVVTKIGCMTELDTSEVIMNNAVKSPEESDFPKMHLAIVGDESTSDRPEEKEEDILLSVAFVNPYTKEEFDDDLQFAMQIVGPAEFTNGGTIGCEENRRLSARLEDGSSQAVVTVRIFDPTAEVRVWAGWATGQNSVRLTPELSLSPIVKEKDVRGEEKEERDVNEVKEDTIPADSEAIEPPPKQEDYKKMVDGIEQKIGHMKQLDLQKKLNIKGMLGKKKIPKTPHPLPKGNLMKNHPFKRPKHAPHEERDEDNNMRRDKERRDIENVVSKNIKNGIDDLREKIKRDRMKSKRSFREKYDSDTFADELDLHRHLFSCVFLVISVGCVLFSTRRRKAKGRRDL